MRLAVPGCREYHMLNGKGDALAEPFGAFWAIKNMPQPAGRTKIAVLSQVLPPSQSVQAQALAELLKDFYPTDYCLISQEVHAPNAHLANYYPLVMQYPRVRQWLQHLPNVNPDKDSRLHRGLRPLLQAYDRLRNQGSLVIGTAAIVEAYATACGDRRAGAVPGADLLPVPAIPIICQRPTRSASARGCL